jgi:16S rRNA (uracil1498-N3)-methyltransferase
VIVFNGRGGWAPGCVESADRKSSVIRPKGFREECRPPGVRLRQALPKGAKQDFVLQKAVELGADEVAFIETDRSVARLPPPGEEDTRLRRWRETVIAAAKQCGAAWLTGVCADAPLDVWLRRDADRPVLVADVRPGARPLCAAWNPSSSGPSPAVYIGPEGGWSDGERALFDRAGAVPVRLGPRVLRTETAPLFVLSAWRYACDSD